MPFWQVEEELATTPAVVKTTASAVLALPFDVAALLAAGETATLPTATLTDLATNEVTRPLVTLSGTVMTAIIKQLTPNRDYRLVWSWVISPTKKPTRITVIRCVA